MDSLERERANLASQCEELRLSLQQPREIQGGSTASDRATDYSAQTDPEEAGGTDSSSDTSRRLVCWKITFPFMLHELSLNYHYLTKLFINSVTQQNNDANLIFSLCVSPLLSLIELRHNIGRLLVSFVPALDLGQVNYECNVIDEILEQVLLDVETITPVGLRDRAIND